MKAKILMIIIAFTALVVNGCGIVKKYSKHETSEYKLNTANKKKISLENINGNITISKGQDSGQLFVKAFKEIKVKKKYLNTPFDEIEIKLDTAGDHIFISTKINEDGSDQIFNMNRKQRVDYEIYLPSDIVLEIENVNGKIMSSGIQNDLMISQVNGDVDLDKFTGKLECEITNGDFSGHFDSTNGIDVNTINGGVTIFLNNYMNANIKAETINGKIVEENLNFRDLMRDKKLLRGKIGNQNSDTDIKIETINGRIRLYGRNEI